MKLRHIYITAFVTVVVSPLVSCDREGLDVLDIETPQGYELSAGTSTIFLNSSKAFDTQADWVSGSNTTRFYRGDKLYDDMRTSSNGYGGGLGPVYAGYSCGSCHSNAGRTKPALWADGGSGAIRIFGDACVCDPQKRSVFPKITAGCFTTSRSTV